MHTLRLAGISAMALALAMGPAHAASISIFGPWLTADQDNFEQVLAGFTAKTGIEVDYAGSDSFEQQIVIDTQAGSAPNIAIFPQPGLAADLASKGLLTPLSDDVKSFLTDNYAAGPS